jgi:hypothetical protein
MSTLEDHNWEEHWREEVDQYTPQPNAADWASMHQLLDRASGPQGQRVIDQEVPTRPGGVYWKYFAKASWYSWLFALVIMLGIGYWLGTVQANRITEELETRLPTEQMLADNKETTENNTAVLPTENQAQDPSRSTPAAAVPSTAPASAPLLPTDKTDAALLQESTENTRDARQNKTGNTPLSADSIFRKSNQSVTLDGVVLPLDNAIIPLGMDYWSRRAQELLESGQLEIERIPLENGHFPIINQRF